MSADKILLFVLESAIFASALALGFKATLADVLYLWRRPALFARAVIAMYVVFPVVTVLVLALPLSLGFKIGLTLLAISSALAGSGNKMLALGGRPSYVYSLLVNTSLLAVVTVPLSLAILTALPLVGDASAPPLQVAKIVAETFLLPLLVGAIFGRLSPRVADRIAGPLKATAGYVTDATLLGLLLLNFTTLWQNTGVLDYLVIAVLVIAGLAVGHWLGGPDPGDRTALAIATAERNTAVAALIAALNFPDRQAVVMIVMYKIVRLLVMIPYTKWCKVQIAARSGAV